MVQNVGWFTPIDFKRQTPTSRSQDVMMRASTMADELFYWGGKVAHITPESSLSTKEVDTILGDHRLEQPFYIALLKVVAYATILIPLIAFAIKVAVRCCVHNFQVIDGIEWGKKAMEAELEIPEGFQEQLESALADIISHQGNSSKVTFLSPYRLDGEISFVVKGFEQLVCKTHLNGGVSQHFNNIAHAKSLCFTYGIDEIGIPETRNIAVKCGKLTDQVLIQRRIPFTPATFEREAEQNLVSMALVAQLTCLIAKMRLCNLDPKDLRSPDEKMFLLNFQTNPRLRLKEVLLRRGSNIPSNNGLIAQLHTPDQVDAMLKCATYFHENEMELSPSEKQEVDKWLEERAEIATWQRENNFDTYPGTAISVDIESLGFDLEAEIALSDSQTITMGEAIKDIMDVINNAIRARPNYLSAVERRRVTFDNYSVLAQFRQTPERHPALLVDEKEYFQQMRSTWLWQILHALREKGAIFSFTFFNSGVEIQA